MSIEIVAGEFGYAFEVTIRNANRSFYSIPLGASVSLTVKEPGKDSFQIGSGLVLDRAAGLVSIDISEVDSLLLSAGVYEGQITISREALNIITQEFKLVVRNKL